MQSPNLKDNEVYKNLKTQHERLKAHRAEDERRWKERETIEKQAKEYMVHLLLKSGLLAQQKWKYTAYDYTGFCLSCSNTSDFEKTLMDIWPHDYHDSVDIAPGVTLRSDDGDVSLRFKDPRCGYAFLKSQNIKVDVSGLIRELRDAEGHVERKKLLIGYVKGQGGESLIIDAQAPQSKVQPEHFKANPKIARSTVRMVCQRDEALRELSEAKDAETLLTLAGMLALRLHAANAKITLLEDQNRLASLPVVKTPPPKKAKKTK